MIKFENTSKRVEAYCSRPSRSLMDGCPEQSQLPPTILSAELR